MTSAHPTTVFASAEAQFLTADAACNAAPDEMPDEAFKELVDVHSAAQLQAFVSPVTSAHELIGKLRMFAQLVDDCVFMPLDDPEHRKIADALRRDIELVVSDRSRDFYPASAA